jgi:uncharacterized protein YbjT (DUF2867 family)
MYIVVVGGTGLVGKPLVAALLKQGHHVVVASPSKGVNALTNEGLDKALEGADVLVDVSQSPSFAPDGASLHLHCIKLTSLSEVRGFFTTATTNLLKAGSRLKHYLALSVVGLERLPDNGYFQAKQAQEDLIVKAGIPWTILRATQFFEFVPAIGAVQQNRLASTVFQPVAAADVSRTLAELAVQPPRNGRVDLGGPESIPMDEAVKRFYRVKSPELVDQVVTDDAAGYFGSQIDSDSLRPSEGAFIGKMTYQEWLDAL